MLEIKDLSVQYGKQAPTIEHFNLSMKKGEIISVVGESGSGKTTVGLNAEGLCIFMIQFLIQRKNHIKWQE